MINVLLSIPPRPPESKHFKRAPDTRTWVDRILPRRRHDSYAVRSRLLVITSFACIPEMGYCSALERGVRHSCEAAQRDAWEHDAGDEDRVP